LEEAPKNQREKVGMPRKRIEKRKTNRWGKPDDTKFDKDN